MIYFAPLFYSSPALDPLILGRGTSSQSKIGDTTNCRCNLIFIPTETLVSLRVPCVHLKSEQADVAQLVEQPIRKRSSLPPFQALL